MEDKIINFLEHKKHTVKGLLMGFLLILLFLATLSSLIDKLFDEHWYYVYILFFIIWLVVWLFDKYKLPKKKKNKLGICLLIYTENKIDEFRFKKDFIASLKKNLSEYSLSGLVDLIIVKNHFSEKIQELNNNDKEIELIKKWNKKIKAHFLIWGGIKKRQEGESKFFLELDSMVYHSPIKNLRIHQEFKREMLTIFPKEISFYEKFELRGFQISAKVISIAIQYIVGTAAFLSYDPLLALKLHKDFLTALSKFKKIPPNFKFIEKRAKKMISTENSIIAQYYYEIKKDLNEMFKFLNEALNFNKENYQAYLLLAIYYFLKYRNIGESFKMINMARKYCMGDWAWRYSEAFLYCYIGELDNAIESYDKAFKGKFLEEKNFLRKIISFIEDVIKEEPNKIQFYFALGKIYYQKLNNLPKALEKLEEFLKSEIDEQKFFRAGILAKSYTKEIKKEMGLNQNDLNHSV
ncbi:hypothetical protein KAU51_02500 [Candidatus Parcubacteria bacterium]|nr:hypothetical protein [Candidatus Parcubacteria bacterium]